MRHPVFATLAPALALLLLGAATPAVADQWNKTYTLSGKPDLRVETDDGQVRLDTWDSPQIEARVETMGWKISDNDVRITESQSGNHVEITVRMSHRWHWNLGGDRRWVRINLKIPREGSLWIHTGDGNVTLGPFSGRARIETGDGHISLDGVKGELALRTGDGHIDGSALDGRLEASTGDGHIEVDGRFDALDLHSNDGHVTARAQPGSKTASTWTVRTGDGSVTLRLPEGFQADLDAHTGDGRISVDFPVTVSGTLNRSSVRGKMNGGGSTLTVRTGDGSIHIEKL